MKMDSSNLTFAFVVITRNRPRILAKLLESLVYQSEQNFTVYIFDDASTDGGCEEVVQHYKEQLDIVLVTNKGTRLGVAGARNEIMQVASETWLISLDDDAVLETRNTLSVLRSAIEANPDAAVFAFNMDNVTSSGVSKLVPFPRRALQRNPALVNEKAYVSTFQGGAHALSSECLQVTGMYRPDLVFGVEELDLSFRIISQGRSIVYLPDILVTHYPQPSVVGGASKTLYSELFYLTRNRLYIAYRYLPIPNVVTYSLFWMFRMAMFIRTPRQACSYVLGLLGAPRFAFSTGRQCLSAKAMEYARASYGRVWY